MAHTVYMENIADTRQLPNYPIECYRSFNQRYMDKTLLHWHFCCEMIFIHSGEQQVNIGGSSLNLQSGDLIYIHPQQVHEFINTAPEGSDLSLLKFNTSLLLSRDPYDAESRYFRPFLPESGYRCLTFPGGGKKMAEYPQKIIAEEEAARFGFETRMRNLICQLISELADSVTPFPMSSVSLSTREQEQFNYLLQYLSEHYAENGLMEQALEICNLSYSNFAAKFKRMYGKTFTEYLNHIRVSNARQMLLNSSDSVGLIAEACGYHDPGYFSRIFRQITGVSPLAYRTEQEKRHPAG